MKGSGIVEVNCWGGGGNAAERTSARKETSKRGRTTSKWTTKGRGKLKNFIKRETLKSPPKLSEIFHDRGGGGRTRLRTEGASHAERQIGG